MTLDEGFVGFDQDFLYIEPVDIRPSDLLHVEMRWVECTAVMVLSGEVCLQTVTILHDRFRAISSFLRGGLVIDLGLVTFLDSTGLSFLVTTQRQLKAEGSSLVVYAPSPRIRRLFDICGLTTYLIIVPETMDVALN
jgi:anti-anti-sigma factor